MYPIGVPVFFFLVLFVTRDELFEPGTDTPNPDKAEQLGFLYAGYTKKYWWWECVELFRKLALTGILAFFKPGTPEQLFLGIVLANVFIVGYAREKPYLEFGASDLQLACQQQVFFVSLSAFAVLTTAGRDSGANPAFTSSAFGMVLLLMGVAPVVVAVLQMFFGKEEAPQPSTSASNVTNNVLAADPKGGGAAPGKKVIV